MRAAVPLGVSEQELEKLRAMPRRLRGGRNFRHRVQAAGEAAGCESGEGSSPAAGASPEQSGFSNRPLAG